MRKSIALALVAGMANLFVSTAAHATDATWTTGTGLWSTENATSLGWSGSKPDAIGDTGTFDSTGKGSATTTQDLAGSRTVGKLEITGSANASWQITLASGKNIIMNQDGAGPGTAMLSNTQTNATAANPSLIINSSAGQIILNDDLLISNTGASIRTSGSIAIDAQITGNGNITFYNVSNDVGHGQIALFRVGAAGSAFGGNSTIAKGAVTFNRGDRFTPTASNIVTIGAANTTNGDATLAFAGGTVGNMENNFVSAANTGGTNVFATTAATTGLFQVKSSSSQTLPHSLVTLNGDLTFSVGGTGMFQVGDPIVGVGKLTKAGVGTGLFRLTNTNTYSGGTVVNTGSLAVGHADAINNGFGFYDATDGTLGSGNVTVNSTATSLQIESSLAAVNVIANSATLSLAGGGTADFADQGYADLGAGIKEVVGSLLLNGMAQTAHFTYGSMASNALIKSDEFFAGTGVVSVGLAGDYNNNGEVDAADYVLWRKDPAGFGGMGGYDLWQQNFGAVAVAGAGLSGIQSVPEPSTLMLMIAGVSLACAGRRNR